ncbi:6357_t:CDS:2, partial [Rhizophagus irregularis]
MPYFLRTAVGRDRTQYFLLTLPGESARTDAAEEAHKRKVEQMESKEYLRAKELQERIRQRLGINEQEHEEKLRKEAEEAHKRKVEQME